jgi:antitoxin (DNA-binding transcriptional repressor) of toxin-antitoxin stability system
MRIFAEPVEAAEQLEALICLAQRDDEVIICREGVTPAALTAVREDVDRSSDRLLELIAEGRPADDRQTFNHDEFYDANGVPK